MCDAYIVATFHVSEKIDIPEAALSAKKLAPDFGDLVINYAHVGRHIRELYYSGDLDLPIEHVKLFTNMSADFCMHFGPTPEVKQYERTLKKIEDWFKLNSSFFEKMDLDWNPQKLGINRIGVAELVDAPCDPIEQKNFQRRLSFFDKILKLELETKKKPFAFF